MLLHEIPQSKRSYPCAQLSARSARKRRGARLRKSHVDATSAIQLVLLREADLPAVAEHGGLRAQIHFTDVR